MRHYLGVAQLDLQLLRVDLRVLRRPHTSISAAADLHVLDKNHSCMSGTD